MVGDTAVPAVPTTTVIEGDNKLAEQLVPGMQAARTLSAFNVTVEAPGTKNASYDTRADIGGNNTVTVVVLAHRQLHELALLKMNNMLQLQLPSLEVIPAESVGPEKVIRREDPEEIKFAETRVGANSATVFGSRAIVTLASTAKSAFEGPDKSAVNWSCPSDALNIFT
jgi:hypothetical protein